MAGNGDERDIGDVAMRPVSPTLAMRYGVPRRRPVSTWLIGVGTVLTGVVSVVGGAGALGVFGALSWGLVLALADRRARRPAALLARSSLAILAALLLPVAPQLGSVLADPLSIALGFIVVVYLYGGIFPLVVTPVIVYLWFARTGRIR